MRESIKIVCLERGEPEKNGRRSDYGYANAQKVNRFHQSFPEYQVTPLWELRNLAHTLGMADIYIKDESYRLGLNAFKVLGGSYGLGKYIAEALGQDIAELSYDIITGDAVRAELGPLTLVTATDGNHGRGVAWTAQRLGQDCVVYMPRGSAEERLDNIKALGAKAYITALNYDDTVRFAKEQAQKYGWVLVQDTAWEGYEKMPVWIMQGYTTMGYEIIQQLKAVVPTHIFLQAGVGAMAGAMTAFFADYYREAGERPIITIVEPDKADCLYRTAAANDGRLHAVTGAMDTIMAGLACGEPCPPGWEELKDQADNFVSIPDCLAAKGMRILGNPMGDDPRIISGESGAAPLGLVAELMQNRSLDRPRAQLQLDANARVLCISTEGDTDKANYRRIVWDGFCPSG